MRRRTTSSRRFRDREQRLCHRDVYLSAGNLINPRCGASPRHDTLSESEDDLNPVIAAVLIFVSAECPVSNRYAPEIQRLYKEFSPKGIRFTLVYPNPSDDAGVIAKHLSDYGLPTSVERDPNHLLVKKAQATVTPEAVVLDNTDRIIYKGRIDDRFVELGRERPAATRHDLRNALDALLAGKPVSPAQTQAVGCFIADMVPR
jgi:hypothetical protein